MFRRILFVSTVAFTSLVLFAGTAFAHFCYVASRSPQGAQSAANHSDSWGSVNEALAGFGLCEVGVEHVRDQITEFGLDPDVVVINERTVMAQGLFRTTNGHLSGNGRGVDWLPEEAFVAFEGWVLEAVAICEGGA